MKHLKQNEIQGLPPNVQRVLEHEKIDEIVLLEKPEDIKNFGNRHSSVAVIVAIDDNVCFSSNCWFIKYGARCDGCTYINDKGKILDKRVGR